jgi:5-methyltetrahydrofolate--homocysteine methyltransferase
VSFSEQLRGPGTLLLDGGLGSALIGRGLALGTPPERWNLERPEDVVAVHRAYVDAGSDAVHTNSFGASPARLAAFGLAERCEELNRAAVALARAAGARFVIGDVGPTGEYLPPVGTGALDAWRASFARQGRALLAAGVDALHVETMSDLREARAALEALLEVAGEVPVMVSMTFERKRRGFFTVMGDPLGASLAALAADGAAAAGANCSIPSGEMAALVEEALSVAAAPLIVQPNAGRPEQAGDGAFRYAQGPDEFAADMATAVRRGVRAIGGCCGTDARFIGALRRSIADGPGT